MYKNVDKQGRIVIPKIMLKKLGLENGKEVRIDFYGDKIIITNENMEKKKNGKHKKQSTNDSAI